MGQNCDIDKRVRFGKGVTLGDNVLLWLGLILETTQLSAQIV